MIDFPTQITIGCILLAVMVANAIYNNTIIDEDAGLYRDIEGTLFSGESIKWEPEPQDIGIVIDGCAPVAILSENSKELTVFVGDAKVIFTQCESGKFERIKIEGGDTGFYWDESGNVHFCIGGVEVEK